MAPTYYLKQKYVPKTTFIFYVQIVIFYAKRIKESTDCSVQDNL